MRIYVDARNITENPAGVGRYAMSLIPRLVEQAPEHEWVIIRHDSNQTAFVELLNEEGLRAAVEAGNVREVWTSVPIDNAKNFALGAGALSKIFDEFGAPDLYHDLFHILPARLSDDLKVVLTLHDFVWMDHAQESQPTWLAAKSIKAFASVAIPYALERADRVISISEPTDLRAQQWLQTPSTIIMHGVDERFFEPAPEPDRLVETMTDGGTYVVAVGNAKPYKNLSTLIDAIALLRARGHENLRACLVGNCAGLVDHAQSSGLKVDRDIFFPGFASDEDLRRYLGHATAFVFPSKVEGFGLPPLEAMAMGTPSIVSNYEPMKTICEGGADLFSPDSPGELADAIERVLVDSAQAFRMSEKARQHAEKFSWDETAAKTLEVYRSL